MACRFGVSAVPTRKVIEVAEEMSRIQKMISRDVAMCGVILSEPENVRVKLEKTNENYENESNVRSSGRTACGVFVCRCDGRRETSVEANR